MGEQVRGHRRSRRHLVATRSTTIIALAVAVLAGGGAAAWALTGGPSSDYRTAAAELGSVSETLDTTGTLQSATSAQLEFQVSGQVASVAVSAGQHVSAGEVLASLDTSALESSVAAAASAVTSAQEKFQADENSETTTTATTTAAATTSSASKPSATAPSSTTNGSAIGAAQATLTSDQKTTDTDSTRAKSDLSNASSMCTAATSTGAQSSGTQSSPPTGASLPTGGASQGGSSSTTTTTTTTAPSPGSTSPTGGSGTPSATPCTNALQRVLADQEAVARDDQIVAQDESQLARLLSADGSATVSNAASGQSVPSTASTSGSGPAPPSVATPDQIAADQATLDAASANLSVAQTTLAEGQLISPMAGTVASVGPTPGQSVSAGSSTTPIVVVGPETYDVSATVSVTDLNSLSIGQTAYVSPDGYAGRLVGHITGVSPLPSSASSSSYAVTVSLPTGANGLYLGASATVSIVEGQASNVVTVPTSAVHRLGAIAYVNELRNGRLQAVNVTLGIMGNDRTEVLSGVKPGDRFELANLSASVPTSSSTGGFAGVGALTGGGGRGFIRNGGATLGG
jgi:multidrug efflux pump subunit AcrA (membrane-fusion protein)